MVIKTQTKTKVADELTKQAAANKYITNTDNQPNGYTWGITLRNAIEIQMMAIKNEGQKISPTAEAAAIKIQAGIDAAIAQWKKDIENAISVDITTTKSGIGPLKVKTSETSMTSVIPIAITEAKEKLNKAVLQVVQENKEEMLHDDKLSGLAKFVNAITEKLGFGKVFEQKSSMLGLKEEITNPINQIEEESRNANKM